MRMPSPRVSVHERETIFPMIWLPKNTDVSTARGCCYVGWCIGLVQASYCPHPCALHFWPEENPDADALGVRPTLTWTWLNQIGNTENAARGAFPRVAWRACAHPYNVPTIAWTETLLNKYKWMCHAKYHSVLKQSSKEAIQAPSRSDTLYATFTCSYSITFQRLWGPGYQLGRPYRRLHHDLWHTGASFAKAQEDTRLINSLHTVLRICTAYP